MADEEAPGPSSCRRKLAFQGVEDLNEDCFLGLSDDTEGDEEHMLDSASSPSISEGFPPTNSLMMAHECSVQTLVFMDLETTGLPHELGKANVQITELTCLAVNRNNFDNLKDFRRVVSKISLCIQPRAAVSPGAAKVSGLNDQVLSSCNQFDANTAKMLCAFLQHLQKPICLLAHNGDTFDFPLLRAELRRTRVRMPADIYCCDTLNGLRAVWGVSKSRSIYTPGKRKLPCHSTSPKMQDPFTGQIQMDTSQENLLGIALESKREKSNELPSNIPEPEPHFLTENISVGAEINVYADECTRTPLHQNLELWSGNENLRQPTSFKLADVYESLYNQQPSQSHEAEGDCITLMHVCHRVREILLPWMEQNKKLFKTVKPMW